jgi:hypothetical protein
MQLVWVELQGLQGLVEVVVGWLVVTLVVCEHLMALVQTLVQFCRIPRSRCRNLVKMRSQCCLHGRKQEQPG